MVQTLEQYYFAYEAVLQEMEHELASASASASAASAAASAAASLPQASR